MSTAKSPPGPAQNCPKAYYVTSQEQWRCTTFVLPAVFPKIFNLEDFSRRVVNENKQINIFYFYEISLPNYKSIPVSVGTHYVDLVTLLLVQTIGQ